MSLISIKDGYYDKKGHWVRTKHCFVACPPDQCTCCPPHGRYQINPDEVTKPSPDEILDAYFRPQLLEDINENNENKENSDG